MAIPKLRLRRKKKSAGAKSNAKTTNSKKNSKASKNKQSKNTPQNPASKTSLRSETETVEKICNAIRKGNGRLSKASKLLGIPKNDLLKIVRENKAVQKVYADTAFQKSSLLGR